MEEKAYLVVQTELEQYIAGFGFSLGFLVNKSTIESHPTHLPMCTQNTDSCDLRLIIHLFF